MSGLPEPGLSADGTAIRPRPGLETPPICRQLTVAACGKDNIVMAGAVKNMAFEALAAEAASLLEKAKEYRAKMEELGADDPRRAVYEQVIRDLLKSSNSISTAVTTTVERL